MMPIDINTFPISGRLLMTLLLWGGVSAFALGPLVATREIERANWGEACAASLATQIDARRPVQSDIPDVGCAELGQLMDGLLGQGAGRAICSDEVGGAVDGTIDLIRKLDPNLHAQDAARELAERQSEQSAELAPTRCTCAADVVASDRLRWAVYAGSGRFIGKGTETLTSDLTQALHQPVCALKPEG